MARHKIDRSGMPINTSEGLREAIWDIIFEDFNGADFTRAEMKERLPYGKRVDNAIDAMLKHGHIRIVNTGVYTPVKR